MSFFLQAIDDWSISMILFWCLLALAPASACKWSLCYSLGLIALTAVLESSIRSGKLLDMSHRWWCWKLLCLTFCRLSGKRPKFATAA